MKQPDEASLNTVESAPSCPTSHRVVAGISKGIIALMIAALVLSLFYILLIQRS